MAKAKKLPSGNWRVLVYDGLDADKKRKYISFTADTAAEAEYMALEYTLKKKRADKPENLTVGEAIDRYIESKDAVLSPSTIRGYKGIRKNNIQGIMNLRLNKINQDIIQREFNNEAKSRSPKSLRNIHTLLSTVLKIYYPDFILRTTLPQKEKIDIYMPTKEEMKLLLNDVTGTEMELPVLLSMCLGLRRSEICGLTWDGVDFKNNTIRIRQAQVINSDGEWVMKNTKSYTSNRTITLNNTLIKKLSNQDDQTGAVVKLAPNVITQRFERIVKRLGMPNFRFHDLRHYNASVMLALNIPDKYAMERMGHATNNILKNVYQHTMDNEKEKINTIVDNYFDELIDEK